MNQNQDSGSSLLTAETGPFPPVACSPSIAAAMRVLIAYLAVTAPLLPLGGVSGGRLLVLLIHLATLAALATSPRWALGRVARLVAAWAPLVIVPLLYAELPLLMEGLPGPVRYHDALIAGLEGRIFGGQPAFGWAGAWPSPALSELLHACYLSYYPFIYLPPLLLYLGVGAREKGARGDSGAFRETVLAVVLAFLSCFLVFVVFPVQGPRYLGVPEGVPGGPVRDLVLAVLQSGSSRGAAFPSSHVSVAVAQALMAARHQPRAARWAVPLATGLALGAVYGGFHYAVDAVAGGGMGAFAASAAGPLRRRLEAAGPGLTSPPATA